ncbi:glycoside hydrolase family 16 protein [Schizophyllum amplum]|uniref:Glycoside hydrolase family 16 protein n=1 Tax=Schizophyllum amplum TaxID=97359 RepID=A0A550BUK6_9AGAR|nr:glycoside hydrolase family 16 protein [Auriculariopsis ampla]
MRSSIFVSFLALTGAVYASSHDNRHARRHQNHQKRGYTVNKWLQGQSLLDAFNYDVKPADNQGIANYVDGPSSGLVYVDGSEKVVISVDQTPYSDLRNAIRMTTKDTFNPSQNLLFIFDIQHIPCMCGTWPALWFTGSNWPMDGEIDVIEGVHLYKQNTMSVHTGSGCNWPNYIINSLSKLTATKPDVYSCDANSDYESCGGSQDSPSSFGKAFNDAGGGIFALELNDGGIAMHQWNVADVPQDIWENNPNPSGWGDAVYKMPADECVIGDHFKDLMLVINTNLGGFFSEGVWAIDGAGGQETSCQKQTNFNSAADYVKQMGSVFGDDARWIINKIVIYEQN